MAFFDELTKKAKDVAAVAADKAKDAADKAKDAAEVAKINVAIAGEQRGINEIYGKIGEWFVNEYEGEIPEAAKSLVEDINAAKARIAELEASKPAKAEPEETVEETVEPVGKKCPICGAESDSRFCPQCGAPMGE